MLLPFLFLLLDIKAQEGALKPAFGNGWFVHLDLTSVNTAFAPNGKLVGVKSIAGIFELYRFDTDGKTDASFGSGGMSSLTFQELAGTVSVLATVQNDGGIMMQMHGNTAAQKQLLIAVEKDAAGYKSTVVTREVRAKAFGSCVNVQAVKPETQSSLSKDPTAVRTYLNPSKGRFQLQLKRLASAKVQVSILDARGWLLSKERSKASKPTHLTLTSPVKLKASTWSG